MADGINAINPLSYWTFPETTGTSSVNAMGGTRATLAGGALFSANGAQGRGVALDGINDYISVAHAAAYAMNAGAISLWFRPDALGLDQGLISKNSTGYDTGGGFTVLLKANGTIQFSLESIDTTFTISSSALATAGGWNNVMVTWGAGGMQLWLNGTLAGTNAYTGGLGTSSGGAGANDPLIFGANTSTSTDRVITGATNYFKGGLDEAVVMSRQPTASEIQAIWLNGSVAGNANPVANADALAVAENGLNPFAGNVLANDTDADSDALSVFAVRGDTTRVGVAIAGTYGVLTLNADGSYTYVLNSAQTNVQALRVGQTLTETFAYTASDGRGGLSTANLVVTINGENDAPVVTAETRAITEDTTTALTGNVITNDRDLDGGVLTVSAVNSQEANVGVSTAGTYGSIVINANGTYSYLLNNASPVVQGLAAGQTGVDAFSYTVSDGQGGFSTTTITVTVTGRNDAPVVALNTATVTPNTAPLATGNVLENDTDADGQVLSVLSVRGQAANVGATIAGTYGSLTLHANGAYTYTLNSSAANVIAIPPGETRVDSFAHVVTDGTANVSSTLQITVVGVNEAPTLVNDARTIQEDAASATTAAANVFSNDRDPDGGTLVVTAVNNSAAGVGVAVSGVYGAITIAANGAYTYTLNNASPLVQALKVGQSVTDTFTYTASDGQGGNATASVVVTVTGRNDIPTVVADVGAATAGGAPVIGNVMSNDSDIDGDAISVTAVRGQVANVGAPITGTYGTLTLNADGSYSYLVNTALTATINLAPGATATDSFAYTIRDVNNAAASSTLTITVTGTNDAPRAVNDARTIQEDVATTTGTALSNDSDPDGGILAVVAVNGLTANIDAAVTGTYGSLTMAANGAYTYALNNALASVQGLRVGQSVTDTFAYTIADGQGGTATASVIVTVTGRNDAPTVVAQATGTVTEDMVTTASGNVANSLRDVDIGDTLVVNQVRGLATNVGAAVSGTYGALTLNADGTYLYTLNNSAPNVQALADGQTVTDSFTFRANDSANANVSNTLVITVVGRAENYAPVANADVVAGTKNIPATFDVRTNDTDPDGDALTVSHIAGTAVTTGQVVALAGGHSARRNADGTITVTPAANYSGNVVVAYTVSDGRGGSASSQATVTFANVNSPPVALDVTATALEDGPAIIIAGNYSDPDVGDTLTVTLGNIDGAAGTVTNNGNGTFTFNSNNFYSYLAVGQTNLGVFYYTVTDDSGASSTARVTVTIQGQNDAPTAAPMILIQGEDQIQNNLIFAAGDPDSIDTRTYSVDTTGTIGVVTVNPDGTFSYDARGRFDYLNSTQSATDTFTYTVTDNHGATATNTVTVTITGSPDAPVANAVTATTTENGAPIIIAADFDDADASGDNFQFQVDATGTAGQVFKNGDTGTFTYSTNGQFDHLGVGQTATDIFRYSVTDFSAPPSVATVMVTVTGQNDAPVLGIPFLDQTVREDWSVNFSFPWIAFTDVDVGDTLTYTATLANGDALPSWLTFDPIARSFSGTPLNADVGYFDVLVTATDPHAAFASDTFRITVEGNVAPPAIIFDSRLQVDSIERVSVTATGAQVNGPTTGTGVFSRDDTRVVFVSAASDLVPGDTNGVPDVFVKNFVTGEVTRVSADASGVLGNGASAVVGSVPVFSLDGTRVAFYSTASNLVPGDTNGVGDIFVKDLATGAIMRVSTDSAGVEGNAAAAGVPNFSPDGTKVMFMSAASNLVAGDTNNTIDLFVKDLATGQTTRISTASNGDQGNGSVHLPGTSGAPRFSDDGTKVAFESFASNLVPGDTNNLYDIFVKNLATGALERVSTTSTGAQANGSSFAPVFSPDGTKLLFWSVANNLVAGDTNGRVDVFVKDLVSGQVTLVSANAAGQIGNGDSTYACFSPDGTKVLFGSTSSNLVDNDTNGMNDIFVKDLVTGAVSRISTNAMGVPGDAGSSLPQFSYDGTKISFNSASTNLVTGDTNGVIDMFVAHVSEPFKGKEDGVVRLPIRIQASEPGEGITQVVLSGLPVGSTLSAGTSTNGGATWTFAGLPPADLTMTPPPNYTGVFGILVEATAMQGSTATTANSTQWVTITPVAAPATIVFDNQLILGDAINASTATNGAIANGPSYFTPAISADGRYVVFLSDASNLVANDTNGKTDIFRKDMQTGEIVRVSTDANGLQGGGATNAPGTPSAIQPSISADGRYVTFTSNATNLVPGDTANTTDGFIKDMQTGAITRLVGALETTMSANNRFVAFQSGSNAHVAGDTNNNNDVFVFDRNTSTTTRISVDAAGAQADNGSSIPSISGDGRYVVFQSVATNLVAGDTNGVFDIFVKDTLTGAITRASTAADGGQANGASDMLSNAISADGRYVVFRSSASNLVAGDTNGVDDVFLKDLQTGAITRLSVNAEGVQGNGLSAWAYISADGRYVTFDSQANNLVPGDTGQNDVFVRDLLTGSITRVSTTPGGDTSNGYSGNGVLSDDGRHVAFFSSANNLVPGDTNTFIDVYVRELFKPFQGDEGGVIHLPITVSASEPNEVVTQVTLSGLPAGTQLSAGTSSDGGATWVFGASPPVGLTMTPPTAYHGAFTLTVTARTNQNASLATATSTVSVVVLERGHAPTLVNDVATTLEDTPVIIDVLANDSDLDGDTFRVTNIAGQNVNPGDTVDLGPHTDSTAKLNLDGTITFTPGLNSSGEEQFGYTITDSTGKSTLGIVSVNVTPVVAAPAIAFGTTVRVEQVTRISTDSNGAEANGATNGTAVFSPDGTRAVFASTASNLVPGDTNGGVDIFVRYLGTGVTTRVSTDAAGNQSHPVGVVTGGVPTLSPDGTKVAFISSAPDLVPGDVNGVVDVFVKDLATGAITRVSTNAAGIGGDADSIATPIWSPDGTKLMFTSLAGNLTPGDANNQYDVFIKDLTTGEVTRVTTTSAGAPLGGPAFLPGTSSPPRFNSDGTKVVFENATPILPGDTNGTYDIFVKDLTTGEITRVSTDAAGVGGNSYSFAPSFSPDGTKVLFWSFATNLVSGDTNGVTDVFVKDLNTGVVTLVSSSSSGVYGNGHSVGASWSWDSTRVIFSSGATNLVAGDTNESPDIFIKDLITGVTSRVSISADGVQANGASSLPLFDYSDDRISFNSAATNLVGDDTNGVNDLFMGFITTPFKGNENGAARLPITVKPNEPGEMISQTVLSGLPAGSVLSEGVSTNGGVTWTIAGAPTANLSMTAPHGYAGSFTLNVTTTSSQGAVTASSSGSVNVTFEAFAAPAKITFEPMAALDAGDVPVNTTTAELQANSAVAALGNGGYAIVWASVLTPGGGMFNSTVDIYMQLYNASGATVGGEMRVNTTAPGGTNQVTPAVTTLADGGFLVTWMLYLAPPNEGEVWARRYNASGAPVGGDFPVTLPFTSGLDGFPNVAALPDGGYIVAWEARNGTDNDVMIQRFAANNSPVGGPVQINQDGIGDLYNSWVELAVLNDGSYVVVWESSPLNSAGDLSRAYARHYSSSGVALGDGFPVSSDPLHQETMPTVAALADGGFAIVWASFQREGAQNGVDVYIQRFDASGARVGPETRVYEDPSDGQGYATIQALPDGGYVVTYVGGFGLLGDGVATGGENLFAQRFNAAGQRVGAPMQINATTAGTQWTETWGSDPAFAVTADGVLVHTFYGDGEIHMRRFDTNVFAGKEGDAIKLPITITADSSDTLYEVLISGLPPGSTLSAGMSSNGGSTWSFAGAPPADLTLQGPAGYNGTFTLTVTARTAHDAAGNTSIANISVTIAPENAAPPLIIDLGGDGVDLISGVPFDFDGDGVLERGGWASPRDAFLAFDRNGDGTVNGIGEISFVADLPGATSDLEGLRAFDSNGDGLLSAADARFGQFGLWQDRNSDGISDAGEFRSLADAGVVSISLDRLGASATVQGGTILGYAAVTFADGSVTKAADTMLGYSEARSQGSASGNIVETKSSSFMPETRVLIWETSTLGAPDGVAQQGVAAAQEAGLKRPMPFGITPEEDAFDFGAMQDAGASKTMPMESLLAEVETFDFSSTTQSPGSAGSHAPDWALGGLNPADAHETPNGTAFGSGDAFAHDILPAEHHSALDQPLALGPDELRLG